MEKRLAAMNLPAMKIRERIAAAVLARLSILKPHKEAARRAGATLSLPMHAALAAKLMYHSVDAMWRAVGDTSTDFNFYTKRGILAGVYGATLLRWFNDSQRGRNRHHGISGGADRECDAVREVQGAGEKGVRRIFQSFCSEFAD